MAGEIAVPGRRIVVVGSLVVDYTAEVERFPTAGETVIARESHIGFGGKGANQAVAAARLGAQVEMIGAVGDDPIGQRYLERLGEFGIGASAVSKVGDAPTATAFITLDRQAENTIVVAPGANARLGPEQIMAHAEKITAADCILLQNEIPTETNLAAAEIARSAGTRIIYNPAPWIDGIGAEQLPADLLIVNENEAAALFGRDIDSSDQLPDHQGLIITRGADTTFAMFRGERFTAQPPTIDRPVDTVGAGDCFVGAIAATFDGENFDTALDFANRAASRSILKLGAQEGVPGRDEL